MRPKLPTIVADLPLRFAGTDGREVDVIKGVARDLVAIGGQVGQLAPGEVPCTSHRVAVHEERAVHPMRVER
jgi:hypothetical protein